MRDGSYDNRSTRKRRWPKVLAITAGVLVALIVAGLAATPFLMMSSFVDRHVDFNKVYAASDYGLTAETLTLTTGDGLKLAAYRVDAENPRAAVVFLSGIHNPSVTAFFGHAAMLRKEGFSSMLHLRRPFPASRGGHGLFQSRSGFPERALLIKGAGLMSRLSFCCRAIRWIPVYILRGAW